MLYYEGNSLRNLPVYHNCVLIMYRNPLVFSCLILRSRVVMLSKRFDAAVERREKITVVSGGRSSNSGHWLKQERFRLEKKGKGFDILRMVNHWNRLPRERAHRGKNSSA